MPIDFPNSPTVGQQYTYNGVGYMFTAEGIWATGLGTGVFVQKAGDTMTGLLTLSGDPTAALGAATKEYVDAHAGVSSVNTLTGALTIAAGTGIGVSSAGTTITISATGGGGGASVTISDTPPASPVAGNLWWESDLGTLWIYYTDVNSSQWVATSGGVTAPVISTVTTQTFTASGTYTPTSGMKFAIIEAVGGGGGGGGAVNAANFVVNGAGGGSGGYSRVRVTAAQIGVSQTVTIGTAGTAGSTAGSNGGNGGNTTVGALCRANGGTGGGGNLGNTAGGGAGGSSTAAIGDLVAAGIPGQGGTTVDPNASPAGNGGNSFFGGGGLGGYAAPTATANGAVGGNYGAGGGGGSANNSAAGASGGVGSAGFVIITEYS